MTGHQRCCASVCPAAAETPFPTVLQAPVELRHPFSTRPSLTQQPLYDRYSCCRSLHNSSCHCPVDTPIETLARQPAQLGRRCWFNVFLIVIPKRHARIEAHLCNGLNATVISGRGATYANIAGNVVNNHRALVVT